MKNRDRLYQIRVLALAAALFPMIGKCWEDFSQSLGKTLVPIPDKTFGMSSREVTTEDFLVYLNDRQPKAVTNHPQFHFGRGRWSVRWGQSDRPVAYVTVDDARDYCQWLSKKTAEKVRLPTVEEWKYAALGGIPEGDFPWGHGEPDGRACFDQKNACRVGSFPPNGFGLYDMAGNVFEWCEPEQRDAQRVIAFGGSWAERDPEMLKINRATPFPRDYRDADVGFRIVVETK